MIKIQITITAVDDDGKTIDTQTGEIDANSSAIDIRQWCMETFVAVKMKAMFIESGDEPQSEQLNN